MTLSLSQSLSLPLVKEKIFALDSIKNGKEDFIEDYCSRERAGLTLRQTVTGAPLSPGGQGERMRGALPGERGPDCPWKVGDS